MRFLENKLKALDFILAGLHTPGSRLKSFLKLQALYLSCGILELSTFFIFKIQGNCVVGLFTSFLIIACSLRSIWISYKKRKLGSPNKSKRNVRYLPLNTQFSKILLKKIGVDAISVMQCGFGFTSLYLGADQLGLTMLLGGLKGAYSSPLHLLLGHVPINTEILPLKAQVWLNQEGCVPRLLLDSIEHSPGPNREPFQTIDLISERIKTDILTDFLNGISESKTITGSGKEISVDFLNENKHLLQVQRIGGSTSSLCTLAK